MAKGSGKLTIIDMHIHLKNRSPCSIMGVEQLMGSLSHKISGICVTDHWKLSPIKNLEKGHWIVSNERRSKKEILENKKFYNDY